MLYLQSLIFGAPTESTEPKVPGAAASTEAAEAVGRESAQAEVATDAAKDVAPNGAKLEVVGATAASGSDDEEASGDEWVVIDEWTRKASESPRKQKKEALKEAVEKEEVVVVEEVEEEEEEEKELKDVKKEVFEKKQEEEEEEAPPVTFIVGVEDEEDEEEMEKWIVGKEELKEVKKEEKEVDDQIKKEYVMEMEVPKMEVPMMEAPKMEVPKMEAPMMESSKMEKPKLEMPKMEIPTPMVESVKPEGKRPTVAELPKRNKRQKSSLKSRSPPKPPRFPFSPAQNPIQAAAWCSKPGMTYAEKLKANMRAANPAVVLRIDDRSEAPRPRVPPTDALEDSIYGCIASLYDLSDRSAIEEAIASAVASPSPNYSTFSGTPGRCSSPAPSDATSDDWLITPPPCFLRSGSAPAPAANPLENLLIEHPSMSVYVRPFETNAGGFSSMSYSFLSSRIDNRLHDVIDISDVDDDDDEDEVARYGLSSFGISEEEEQEEEEEKVMTKLTPTMTAVLAEVNENLPSSRPSVPVNASVKRQTLPKGALAKYMAKRHHALPRQALMEAVMAATATTTSTTAATAASPPHTALTHAPLTPMQVNAQKRRALQKSKSTSKQRCVKMNAAYHAASLPRGAVTRRHKMAACPSGANNNRKCNTSIRC